MSIYEYRIPERNYDQDKIKKQIFIKSKMTVYGIWEKSK